MCRDSGGMTGAAVRLKQYDLTFNAIINLCVEFTVVYVPYTNNTLRPDRSQPGLTMTAPTVRHWDVGDKCATGVPKIKKIRSRENISVGKWNVRTLRPAGKLEQLTHAMSRYHWNIVGLCEMRCKKLW